MRSLALLLLVGCRPPGSLDAHVVESEIVGEDYDVWVWTPDGYDEQEPHATWFLLDGLALLEETVDVLERSRRDGNDLQTVVVAAQTVRGGGFRARDYYPPRLDGTKPECLDERPCGEAHLYFDFLETELLPWLHERYVLHDDPAQRGIYGVSGGGTGVVYAFLTRHHVIGRFLASSPWLLHDTLLLFDYEADLAARTDRLDARLYIATGGDETWYTQFVPTFVEELRSHDYDGLVLKYDLHPGDDHNSQVRPSVDNGIPFLYRGTP